LVANPCRASISINSFSSDAITKSKGSSNAHQGNQMSE
jgi:hypothetical protein